MLLQKYSQHGLGLEKDVVITGSSTYLLNSKGIKREYRLQTLEGKWFHVELLQYKMATAIQQVVRSMN